MTTPSPPSKKLSHEDFTKKRADLIKQLQDAISRRDKKTQQNIRRQLLSDDLVP